MIIKFTLIVLVIFTAGSAALAQNTNSSQTVRPRTTVSPSTTSKTSDIAKEYGRPTAYHYQGDTTAP